MLGAENPPPADIEHVQATPSWHLQCASFPVRYPVIVNAELIDGRSREAMEVSWSRGTFPARVVPVFHLRDVYVVGNTLIFNSDLKLIENASIGVEEHAVTEAVSIIRETQRRGGLQHEAAITVIAKRQAGHNYGHFLVDMLPIAAAGRLLLRDRQPKYLAPSASPEMLDVMLRAFRLSGISLSKIVTQDAKTPIHFNEIIVIAGLTHHGTYMSPFSVQTLASLAPWVAAGTHRKIFVIRAEGAVGQRPLLNQAEIANRLAACGFIVIEPGTLTLEEQISAFRGAEYVVGVFGAAMTNIAFCNPGTTIISLVPARYPDTFFWFISMHRGHNYLEVRGDQVSYDGDHAWVDGFRIREEDIQFLETVTADKVAQMARYGHETAHVTLVHMQDIGDQRAWGGQWAGHPSGSYWIEGVSIAPPPNLGNEQVRYQVVAADGALSEWMQGGSFAGSRGKSQPICGVTLELLGDAASSYQCRYEARFADGTTSGLCVAGQVCISPTRAPMVALRVEFIGLAGVADETGRS